MNSMNTQSSTATKGEMGMDKGEFIANGYSVEVGDGGSFVVVQGGMGWSRQGYPATIHGFSNFRDLLAWLDEEHRTFASDFPVGKHDLGKAFNPSIQP